MPEGKTELVEIWRTGEALEAGDFEFVHAAVTPDERFVGCLLEGRVLFFDVGERSFKVAGVELSVKADARRSIALSADGGKLAVTGGKGGETWLFGTASLVSQALKLGGGNGRRSRDQICRFGAEGKLLYIGGEDGMVRVIDLAKREEIASESWQAHSHPVSALAVSQGGDLIATAGGSAIAIWSAEKKADERRRLRLQIDAGPGARNWLRFAGGDTLLLHTAPDRPVEVMEAP